MYPVIHIAGQSIQTYYLMAILAGIVGYVLSMIKLKPLLSSWERRLLPLGLIVFAIVVVTYTAFGGFLAAGPAGLKPPNGKRGPDHGGHARFLRFSEKYF